MESMKIGKATRHLFFERLGVKISENQQIGLTLDRRLLIIQKDKTGLIVGIELA